MKNFSPDKNRRGKQENSCSDVMTSPSQPSQVIESLSRSWCCCLTWNRNGTEEKRKNPTSLIKWNKERFIVLTSCGCQNNVDYIHWQMLWLGCFFTRSCPIERHVIKRAEENPASSSKRLSLLTSWRARKHPQKAKTLEYLAKTMLWHIHLICHLCSKWNYARRKYGIFI